MEITFASMRSPLLILLLALVSGCSGRSGNQGQPAASDNTVSVPLSGTVVDADSMLIPDPLNKLYFSVRLVANDNSRKGSYNVIASYGYNDAHGQLTMPDAGKP